MAILKDTLIQGSARVTDTLYTATINSDEATLNKVTLNTNSSSAVLDLDQIDFVKSDGVSYGKIATNTGGTLGLFSKRLIAICPAGLGSEATSTAATNAYQNADGVYIDKLCIYPINSGSTMSLGKTDRKWANIYSIEANLTTVNSTLVNSTSVTVGPPNTANAADVTGGINWFDTGNVPTYAAHIGTGCQASGSTLGLYATSNIVFNPGSTTSNGIISSDNKVYVEAISGTGNGIITGLRIVGPMYGNDATNLASGHLGNISYGDPGTQIRFINSSSGGNNDGKGEGAIIFTNHNMKNTEASSSGYTFAESSFHFVASSAESPTALVLKGRVISLLQNTTYNGFDLRAQDTLQAYARFYVGTLGTTSTNGVAQLTIGNGIASGTKHNAYGLLRIYSNSAYYNEIRSATGLTTSQTWYLSNVGGARYIVGSIDNGYTAGGVLYGYNTSGIKTTAAGTSGQFLMSNGASAPSWSTLPSASDSAAGIIQIGNGELQAAAGNHTHSTYLEKAGGTMTGQITKQITSSSYYNGRENALIYVTRGNDENDNIITGYQCITSFQVPGGTWDIGTYSPSNLQNVLKFSYVPNEAHDGIPSSNISPGNDIEGYEVERSITFKPDGSFTASKVYNAVWNDYAEYRRTLPNVRSGQCVIDKDDGSLEISNMRLQPGAQIVSDTWGHIMGETNDAKTPIAVAGRVLAYTTQSRENYHAGMAVCSGPNGTVDIMTREEIKEYPDCIIGYVSEIPNYETWGSGNVKVDNRIWIRVK